MRVVVAAIVILLAMPVLAQEPRAKSPIPEDAAQQAALKLVAEVYKADYEKAKSQAQRIELAKKLLGVGIGTIDDAVSRYVLLRLARDISAQQGDLVTALEAIGRIDGEFKVDRSQQQVDAAKAAAKSLKSTKDHQAFATQLTPLITTAMDRDRYDHAKSLTALALDSARDIRDTERIKQLAARVKEIEQIAAEFEKTREAMLVLESKSGDPAANFIVGRFLCLYKGQWNRGTAMLALGNNETFKEPAALELTAKPDPLKLGELWWKIADALEGNAKSRVQAHAAEWYREALPGLSGLARAKVERQLVGVIPIWSHVTLHKATVSDGFVRISPGGAVGTKELYSGPLEITVVARTEGENIRLDAPQGACVIFNWERNQSELRVNRPDGDNNRLESGGIATARVTPLKPNTWYTLRWRITPKEVKILVDGKEIFSEQRPAILSAKASILVRAISSNVDVKELVVRTLAADR